MQEDLKWKESLKEEGQYLNKQPNTQQNTTSSVTLIIQALQYLQVKTQLSPTALKELLRSKILEKYTREAEEQKWLGAYTNKQRQHKELPPTAKQILKKWENIPDIVYSVNKTIRQQLLPTKT